MKTSFYILFMLSTLAYTSVSGNMQ